MNYHLFVKRLYIMGACAFFLATTSAGCAEQETITVTDKTQTGIAITIYNSNLALVKDTRHIAIAPDISLVQFMDVASRITPTSVHVKSLTEPESLVVLEQNYEFDLMSPQKLMDKYVGKEVKLIFKSQLNGSEEERSAVLLSNNQGPIYKIGDEIHLGFPGRVILPKIPENLLAKPTLVWMIQNSGQEEHDVEVSYLTSGVSWRCDYVLVISPDEKTMDLTAWISIDNRSGTTYSDATIQLVAGDVQRANQPRYAQRKMYAMDTAVAPRVEQFKEESFFEYHLYNLQRKSTLKNNQIKQIALFETTGIPLSKIYKISGQRYYYTTSYRNNLNRIPVDVVIEFTNSEKENLGMPLPKGIIRTYKADSKGTLQFTGENSINHTPKDEKVSFKIGEAFDITAERKQLTYRKVRSDLHEVEWEIAIKNHKAEDVTVIAEENLPGDWKIEDPTVPYEKIDAHRVRFVIAVKADSETKMVYTARIKY